MLYAMGEIVIFLLAAAIIGGLIGSVLCRAKARREVELRIDQAHRTHATELGQLRARLDDRNVEIVDLSDQIAEAQGRLRAMESELAASSDSAETDRLLEELRRQIEEAAARAVAAEHARDAALREAAEAHEAVAEAMAGQGDDDLESELADRDRAIRDLEVEVADLRVAMSRPAAEEQPDGQLTMDVPGDDHDLAGAVAEIARRLQGDHAPADDDLTRIRGIGPKISTMLKELGITSFRQVAGFTPDDVRVVSEALQSFPDRIERDGWMASARALHEAKYGASPD